MLSEQQAAAVGFFFPANHAQPQFPLAPTETSSYAGHQHSSGSTDSPVSPTSSSKVVLASKRRCSVRSCKRVAAENCGLCKACCGNRGQGCTARTHRAKPPTKVHIGPFTPTRPSAVSPQLQLDPTAVTPTEPTLSTVTSTPVPEAAPRLFREDMSDLWAKEWNDREQEVRARREAAELKRKNEQAMARQVVIRVWRQVSIFCHQSHHPATTESLKDGCTPITIRHQNIATYPTLNIAQSEALMLKIGTNAGAAVEIWSPRIKTWCVEDVDHSMNLKGQPELLIRFMGVTTCPGFATLIGESSDKLSVDVSDSGKRKLPADGDQLPSAARARQEAVSARVSSAWFASSPSPSPYSLPESATHYFLSESGTSFPSPSPSSSFPSSPILPGLNLSYVASPDNFSMQAASSSATDLTEQWSSNLPIPDYDSLWNRGYVHVPDVQSWPSGMYARDMAWGLRKLMESRINPEGRFCTIFPGVPYRKATVYRQRDAFFKSTVGEMNHCFALPRSAGGLWMKWRSGSTGWATVAKDRKK